MGQGHGQLLTVKPVQQAYTIYKATLVNLVLVGHLRHQTNVQSASEQPVSHGTHMQYMQCMTTQRRLPDVTADSLCLPCRALTQYHTVFVASLPESQ